MKLNKLLSFLLLCLLIIPDLHADVKKLNRTVTLLPSDGEPLNIASIELTRQKGDVYSYKLEIDDSKFSNHFLSMRPFKCFEGPKQMLCYLP